MTADYAGCGIFHVRRIVEYQQPTTPMRTIKTISIVGGNYGNTVLEVLDSSTTSKDRNNGTARFNLETKTSNKLSVSEREDVLDSLIGTELIVEFKDRTNTVVSIANGKHSKDRNTRFHLEATCNETLDLNTRKAILSKLKNTHILRET